MTNAPHTRRQEQAIARRRQLIHTALLLFSEKGYRGTSVRDIARAAGVNEGLLYHYFSGKGGLFRAVLNHYAPVQAFGAYAQSTADAQPAQLPFEEALRAYGREFIERIRENRTFIITMLTEAPNDPELGTILSDFLKTTNDNITRFLAVYRGAGQISPDIPIETAARVLQGSLMFQFLAEALRAPSSPQEDEKALYDTVAVLLTGLAPR